MPGSLLCVVLDTMNLANACAVDSLAATPQFRISYQLYLVGELMASKSLLIVLTIACAFLGYRVLRLESDLHQLQRNAAIAVLSAEIANKKIGAIAPYFGEDKDAFANAWIDEINLPGAVFPEDVLVPLQNELARKRTDPVSQKMKTETFH